MVCYAVPAVVAALSIVYRRRYGFHGKHAQWFTMLFSGGSVFGIVDHLWNGELFLIGPNLVGDLLLGLAITAALSVAWLAAVHFDRARMPATAEA
ncbi:MAG: hypothetical protein V1744_02795 [Candidatus Altiarchaeota archaeon]